MKLHQAAAQGNLKKVRELLAAGTPPDERDKDGGTPLMAAATLSRANVFQALLEAGADPNAVDGRGESVLHYTVTFATPAMLRMLLERQPDLEKRNAMGETPLFGALSAATAEPLLEAGADVRARRNDGLTLLDLCEIQRKFNGTRPTKLEQMLRDAAERRGRPTAALAPTASLRLPAPGTGRLASPTAADVEAFQTAAQRDDPAGVRATLEAGMPVDVRDDRGRTALHLTALRGCLGAVRVLLAAGPDRSARDVQGYTALHCAAEEGRTDVARELLAAGFDVNAPSGTRSTPLMLAASGGHADVARVLLEAGAAVNVRNELGATTLSVAHTREMKRLLRAAGADDRTAEPLPLSPAECLLQAAATGDLARLRELLAAGVPVESYVRYGHTSLRLAASGSDVETARALLEAGADLHTRADDGDSLLHAAVWGGHAEMVRFLLGRGLDVNAANRQGLTPLMAAAVAGHVEVARVLVQAGADVNARGDFAHQRKKTALQYARQLDDRGQRQALLALFSGKAAVLDPVEAAFEAVTSFAEAANRPAFQEMLKVLADVCDKAPTPCRGRPGVYQCARPNTVRLARRYADETRLQAALRAAAEPARRAYRALKRLREEVVAAGFQLLSPESGHDPRTGKLLVFPTADKYAVLAAQGTNGANHGLSTHDLIAWLRGMEKQNPFVLIACGHDFLAGDFVKPVAGARRLAERMVEFCPDLLDGEVIESASQVAQALKSDQAFFFWWD